MTEYDKLKRLIAEGEVEVNKSMMGQLAAGRRLRKKMQEVKEAAQGVRKAVAEARKVK